MNGCSVIALYVCTFDNFEEMHNCDHFEAAEKKIKLFGKRSELCKYRMMRNCNCAKANLQAEKDRWLPQEKDNANI